MDVAISGASGLIGGALAAALEGEGQEGVSGSATAASTPPGGGVHGMCGYHAAGQR